MRRDFEFSKPRLIAAADNSGVGKQACQTENGPELDTKVLQQKILAQLEHCIDRCMELLPGHHKLK